MAEFRPSPEVPPLYGREEGRHREVEEFLALEEEEELDLGFSDGPSG